MPGPPHAISDENVYGLNSLQLLTLLNYLLMLPIDEFDIRQIFVKCDSGDLAIVVIEEEYCPFPLQFIC